MTTLQEAHALALTKYALALKVVEAARLHRARCHCSSPKDFATWQALDGALDEFDMAEEPAPAPAAPPAPSPDERWREAYERGRLAGREECAKLIEAMGSSGSVTPAAFVASQIRQGVLAQDWRL